MKFLTGIKSPSLTLTRTKRTGLIDEVSNYIVLNETVVKLEITIPSFVAVVKQKIEDVLAILFLPRFYAV